MLRNLLSSTGRIISSLDLIWLSFENPGKVKTASEIATEVVAGIVPEMKLPTFKPIPHAEAYSDIMELDDSEELSNSKDPIIQQLFGLLQKKRV